MLSAEDCSVLKEVVCQHKLANVLFILMRETIAFRAFESCFSKSSRVLLRCEVLENQGNGKREQSASQGRICCWLLSC